MSQSSLAGALYRRVMILLVVIGMTMAAILYAVAQKEVRQAADHQLVNATQMLYILMREELAAGIADSSVDDEPAALPPLLSAEDREVFRTNPDWGMFAVFRQGTLIGRSRSGPASKLVPLQPGFHDFSAPDGTWRSYGLLVPEKAVLVVVAERHAARDLAFAPVARRLALPLLLMVAASAGLVWLAMRRGLREIRRLGAELRARRVADLTPLAKGEWPRDFEPLILSLNSLFARLDQAFELEQAFTDDVAHQLRTPLAAIRAQAQLLRKMASPDLRHEADQLMAAVDRANDLVGGMLTLARLDATAIERIPVDIGALVADLVADQLRQWPPEDIVFSVSPDRPVLFDTDPSLLKISLAAVIENAARHAATGGHVDIAYEITGAGLEIRVADHGPGIPSKDRQRLLQRFERGASDMPGSGLGLSIAARATSILNGDILLDDAPGGPGLLVTIRIASKDRLSSA
ncbi:MAG: ATP-binding protein [Sphingobium sp.]